MKAEDAKKIVERIKEEGSGQLVAGNGNPLKIDFMGEDNFAWTTPGGVTHMKNEKEIVKELSRYKDENIERMEYSQLADDEPVEGAAAKRPSPTNQYTIWQMTEDGGEVAVETFEGTRADAYVRLEQEQAKQDHEPVMKLRKGDASEEDMQRRPLVAILKGGWKKPPVSVMEKSSLYKSGAKE